MPKLMIDNRAVDVPAGTKVIEAAERVGIRIPRFCYHPALGSVGACRVCAVKFMEGPVNGIQMSCMVEAKDAMVVSTTDEEVVDFRRHVIEWLMLHHPHDCPVCDEGGHCLLQDMTVSGGHGLRRYRGPKRTHTDQYLGPLVQHEMNRCIQCYRCVRYYQEFTGYQDLGVMQIGSRVYYGRYREGTLESPFAGNLIDVCPTGVYTDKPSRYRGRRWDFERGHTVCIHCSLGCHIVADSRYREVIRHEARFSENVNGHFICDRGRYGFPYASHPERPRTGRVQGEPVPWGTALETAEKRLDEIAQKHGPSAVAAMGSFRNSLETQGMLRRVCEVKSWQAPVFAGDAATARNVREAVTRSEPDLAVSLREVETSDFILVTGADPLNEAPMLVLALRQAVRGGGRVVVMDPRPIDLPFEFEHLPISFGQMASGLGQLIQKSVDRDLISGLGDAASKFYDAIPEHPENQGLPNADRLAAIADGLRQSKRPVIVCGTDVVPEGLPGLAADLALLLRAGGPQTGLFYLLPGPNAFGASLISDLDTSLDDILSGIESGGIHALIVVEADLFQEAPDRERLQNALDKLDLLVVFDYLHSPTARAADILVPTLTLYETQDIFINQEGRAQQTPVSLAGGEPITQISRWDHPPRTFRKDIPGRDMAPAWMQLAHLGRQLIGPEPTALMQCLAEMHPVFQNLPKPDAFPSEGVRLRPKNTALRFQFDRFDTSAADADTFEILAVDWTFGTEELSAEYSPSLKKVEKGPCAAMHPEDAASLGLSEGETLRITTEAGGISAPVHTAESMARRTLVVPRHRDLDWQHLGGRRTTVSKDQLRKPSKET